MIEFEDRTEERTIYDLFDELLHDETVDLIMSHDFETWIAMAAECGQEARLLYAKTRTADPAELAYHMELYERVEAVHALAVAYAAVWVALEPETFGVGMEQWEEEEDDALPPD